jgi:hypothetical protein
MNKSSFKIKMQKELFMISSTLKTKVFGGALVFITAITIALFFMHKSVSADLVKAKGDLDEAVQTIDTLQSSIAKLHADAKLRGDLNFKLAVELSVLKDDYAIVTDELNKEIHKLMEKREQSTIKVDKTNYIKESYVNDVSTVVLDSMWSTYCNAKKTCSPKVAP